MAFLIVSIVLLLLTETQSFYPASSTLSAPLLLQRILTYRQELHSAFNDDQDAYMYETKFDKLKSFDSRLSSLERAAPSMLEGFYEKHLKSFSVKPGSAEVSSSTPKERTTRMNRSGQEFTHSSHVSFATSFH